MHLLATARRSESRSESPQRYDQQVVIARGTQTAYYQQASSTSGPLVYQEQPSGLPGLPGLPGLSGPPGQASGVPVHGSPTRAGKPALFHAERGVPEGAASSSPALYDNTLHKDLASPNNPNSATSPSSEYPPPSSSATSAASSVYYAMNV